jgi:hypothetical protein
MTGDVYYNEDQMVGQGEAPDIIGVGDSWFHHPFGNILTHLSTALNRNYTILALGGVGWNAADYAEARFLESLAMSVRTYRTRLKLLAISGGGNDFAGPPDFGRIIRDDCSRFTAVDECFEANEPGDLFGEVARACGAVIKTARDAGFSGPVLLHNYDYAIPTGKGFAGFGKWLKYPMDTVRMPNALRRPLINALIDRLGESLEALSETDGNARVLPTPGTLSSADWRDELHPTNPGFRKLVRKHWQPAAQTALG